MLNPLILTNMLLLNGNTSFSLRFFSGNLREYLNKGTLINDCAC